MKLPRGVGRAALGQGAVRRTVMARGRAPKSMKNPFCSFAARCVAGGNAFKTGCPMVRKCCCSVGGKPCTRGEVIREVSAKQLERWASNYNKPDLHTNQIVSYDAKRSGSKPFVCSYHALDILGELTSPAYFAAVAKPGRDPPPKPDRRDVVKCVLKAVHSHEKQLAKDAEQARVSMDASTPPPPPAEEEDELTTKFLRARKYISEFSFVFAFCMSLFNSVLLLNKEKGVGRTNWDSPEGVDVCAEINQIFASTSTPSTRHSHHKHDVCSTAWR